MHFHRFFPIAVAVLLASVAIAEDGARGAERDSLEQLDRAARESWVATRLDWLDDANRAVLSPEAVEKQRSRFEQALDDFVQDRPGWRNVVEQFDEELALSQRAAIEHLTRRYRIEAYQTFRGDRPQYEERRQRLGELLAASRESSEPDGERHKVVAWLLAATETVTSDGQQSLPPLPRFDARAEATPELLSIAESDAPKPMPGAESEATPGAEATDVVPDSAVADLVSPGPAADRFATIVATEVVRPRILLTAASVDVPLGVRQSVPRPHHVAMLPSLGLPVERTRFVETPQPTTVGSTSLVPWRRPPSIAGVTRPQPKTRPSTAPSFVPTPSSVAITPSAANTSGDPLAFARTGVDQLTMASTRGPTSGSLATTGSDAAWPRRAASTRTSSDRSSENDASSPPVANARRANAPDVAGDVEDAAAETPLGGIDPSTMPNRLADINMEELRAQIAGTNMAMRKLAAKVYEDRVWDAEALTPILDQLAPLVARKDGLQLIRECVPESQRKRLGELESGSDLIADLGSKIAQARSDLAEGRFQGTPAQRRAQLDQLDRLSRRLASLVFND